MLQTCTQYIYISIVTLPCTSSHSWDSTLTFTFSLSTKTTPLKRQSLCLPWQDNAKCVYSVKLTPLAITIGGIVSSSPCFQIPTLVSLMHQKSYKHPTLSLGLVWVTNTMLRIPIQSSQNWQMTVKTGMNTMSTGNNDYILYNVIHTPFIGNLGNILKVLQGQTQQHLL